MQSKAYPYPEIVTGDTWTVHQTPDNSPAASTDNLNKNMHVPLNRNCEFCGVNHSRMIRRHELGHVKWSPKTMGKLKPGVRKEAVEVLEEIRVNFLLARNKLDLNEPTMCLDSMQVRTNDMLLHASISKIILYGMASMWPVVDYGDGISKYYRGYRDEWCPEYKAVQTFIDMCLDDINISEIRKEELRFAQSTMHRFYRNLTDSYHSYGMISYRKVQKLAADLSHILNAFTEPPKKHEIYANPQDGLLGAAEESEEDGTLEEQEAGAGASNNDLERRMRKGLLEQMRYHRHGVGTWGDMEIHKPPLTVNLTSRLKNGRAYRPADIGYNPKYINRYCVDKKIFKQKQHVMGGTILIDASGTMCFSGQDILEILQLLPAATIAMYNGSGYYGDLRIIAKNGRRVDEQYMDRHSGKGNVVDGPALDWLSTMPARRIWVSDMHVFGRGNDTGINLVKYCYEMCTKHKIINLKDVDEVKEHALKLNVV